MAGTHTVISAIFTFAMSRSYMNSNPLDRLSKMEKPRQIAKHEPRRLSDEEVRALCASSTPAYQGVITTLAWTGLRVSEALGLRWQDVDFDAGEITVRHQLDERGQLKRPKTKAGQRTIPLVPVLAEELKRHRRQQFGRGFVAAERLIFLTASGKPVDRHNVLNQGIKVAAEKAGLNPPGATKVATHDLRRAFISHLILGLGLDPVQCLEDRGTFQRQRDAEHIRRRVRQSDAP